MKKENEWYRFLSSAAELSSGISTIADPENKLLFGCPAMAEMHGDDSDKELLDRSLEMFENLKQMDRTADLFIRIVNEKKKNISEFEKFRENGISFAPGMATTLRKVDKGPPPALSADERDMTKSRKAEKEFEHSRDVYKTIVNSMNDAVSLINIDDLSIVDVNKAFLEQYGLSKEDIIGRPCFEVTHNRREPCCPPHDICPLNETVQEGRTAHAEHIHFLPDGTKTFAEITTSPIFDKRGKVTQVVHIARNITERKLAEEERENLIEDLQKALSEIKTLRGLLPICMNCHKIRTEQGAWDKLETYISQHSDAEFTHGICPDCFKKEMAELEKKE